MSNATVDRPTGTRPVETTRWTALGCRVELVTRGAGLTRHTRAVESMRRELDAVDLASSRFRDDSELTRVNARPGRWHPVSARFLDLVEDCLTAARQTDGLVTPTLGRPLSRLGYDRDLSVLPVRPPATPMGSATGALTAWASRAFPADRPPAQAWRQIEIDRPGTGEPGLIRIPQGIALDVGSVGKAAAADRIAALLAADTLARVGGLVNLGGDIAIVPAGRQSSGQQSSGQQSSGQRWEVAVDESGRDDPRPPRTAVGITDGGMATSSTAVRVWSRHGVRRHHILDPRTGLPAQPHWRCVSVHAGDCRAANAASTAAIILGPAAPGWLAARGFAARLVGGDDGFGATSRSRVPVLVGGWPADVEPMTPVGHGSEPDRREENRS